jgi:hypothetical protein
MKVAVPNGRGGQACPRTASIVSTVGGERRIVSDRRDL